MNHLGTDGSMRVVFDAGDAKLEDAGGAEDDADEEGLRLDLSRLAGECLFIYSSREVGRRSPIRADGAVVIPLLAAKYLQPGMNWEEKTLCPSLSKFRFSGDSMLDLGLLDNPVDDILPPSAYHRATAPHATAAGAAGPGLQPIPFDAGDAGADVFGGQDFGGGGDDDGGGGGGEDFFSAEQWDEPGAAAGASSFPLHDEGAHAARAPPAGAEMVVTHDSTGAGMFDFFDGKALKNWAGPEHWKMRRAPPRAADAAAGGDGAAAGRARREKTAFAIKFGEAPAVGQKELFAAAPPASLRAPRAKAAGAGGRARGGRTKPAAAKEDEFVLPDDIHFSSQVLLRLFLKPKTLVGSPSLACHSGVDDPGLTASTLPRASRSSRSAGAAPPRRPRTTSTASTSGPRPAAAAAAAATTTWVARMRPALAGSATAQPRSIRRF